MSQLDGTMVYVYRLPERLSDGFCFGGGRPITFQNVDWFNGFDGMKREDLERHIRTKQYANQGDRLLIMSPENDLSFTMDV